MHGYKYAIVVGASSGIGAELVRQLARDGARVAAVARRTDRLQSLAQEFPDRVIPVAHDVTNYDAVPALFQEVTGKLGGLDLVIYAAGVMPEVGAHEYSFEKDRQMIEVNLLGAMAWLDQAAIRFENTKSGTIVGIGSVAGDRGRAGQPAYNTSKAALTTYLEALRNRLSRFGVRVVTIKPGPTATEMTAHLNMKGMMDPAKVAEITLEKSHRTGEHYVKLVHRVAFAVIRRIPSGIFRKLSI
jgi:NAD(P)-dependent dehydrogenase (short-subunit alcohol dehydrogenase family)